MVDCIFWHRKSVGKEVPPLAARAGGMVGRLHDVLWANPYHCKFMRKIYWILLLLWFSLMPAMAQVYRVGDLYTAPDGSKGIVYYLHPDGSGGWVVALNDASTGCAWGTAADIAALANQDPGSSNRQQLLNDTAGYAHTQAIRTYQNNDVTTAAGVVNFVHGWYLPSPAQLSILYGQLPLIENALTAAGGTTLTTDNYWSSAEQNSDNAWYVSFNYGSFQTSGKTGSCRVRAVRSFTYPSFGTVSYTWSDGSTSSSVTVSPTADATWSVTATAGNCTDNDSHGMSVVNCVPAGDARPCPGMPTVTDYDGNVYNTVQIGNQCWMRENLRTTHYADGVEIPSFSIPGNDVSNLNIYGYLYPWENALMRGAASSNTNPSRVQGVCPSGWHVPSLAEYEQLFNYVRSVPAYLCDGNIAKALASGEMWNNSSNTCAIGNNLSTNNATGFSALPASYSVGDITRLGCTTHSSGNTIFSYGLSYDRSDVSRWGSSEGSSYPVRCVLGMGYNFPSVTTHQVSNITLNSVICGGEVTAYGNTAVIARGVCWGSMMNPTVDDAHTNDGSGSGAFTSSITGLEPNTHYYVRAYATDSSGTAYGGRVEFMTSDTIPAGDAQPCPGMPTVTDYDGNVYNTVKIGNQCWMKENLRTTHYADGVEIPAGSNTSNDISYRYSPGNNYNNVDVYGCLYNWSAVVHGSLYDNNGSANVRGVCPIGWHIPSDAEWMQLIEYVKSVPAYRCLGYASSIAKALADSVIWWGGGNPCCIGNNLGLNNLTGFSAIPAGYRGSNNFTYGLGVSASFWSATDSNSLSVSFSLHFLNYNHVERGFSEKSSGYSVRCVLDETGAAGDSLSCPGMPTVTDYDGNVYNTVQIGNQCWMRENLRTTHYADGTLIPSGTTVSTTDPYRYAPNGDASNVPAYGYLYNWPAVMHGAASSSANPSGVQGICPAGWHVPSDAEWTQLTDYVGSIPAYQCEGGSGNIAKALATNTGWSSHSNTCAVGKDPNTNNATGFGALPAGYYHPDGFFNFGEYAFFRSATENGEYSWNRYMAFYNAGFSPYSVSKNRGYSVRCVLGAADSQPCTGHETVSDYDGNVYNTIQLGNQCWMKENLRTTHFADGVEIPASTTVSSTEPYRHLPGSNPVATYGYLYNWTAVMHGAASSSANPSAVQGICPAGWHVPSDAEWTQLTDYLSSQSRYVCGDNSSNIAKALAATTGWAVNTNSNTTCTVGGDQSTNNTTGFGAMQAGGYHSSGFGSSTRANLWSCTVDASDGQAWYRYLSYLNAAVGRNKYPLTAGYSVRCLLGAGNTRAATVGDILCTDGTWVSPSDYATSGKTAMGVIFHVDDSGYHGWAVNLQEYGIRAWSTNSIDIPNLTNYTNASDTAGYGNTQIIRNSGDASTYPAAWTVDFNAGWYLPAIGQLSVLREAIDVVNLSLSCVGGDAFGVHPFFGAGAWYYWSSTEYSDIFAWFMGYTSPSHNGYAKSSYYVCVRGVRTF